MGEVHSNREPGTLGDVVSPPSANHTATLDAENQNATVQAHPTMSDRTAILAWLQQTLPNSRLQHVLRVETLAVELATCHGVDLQQAAQAGLMHDLAKYFKPARLLELVMTAGLVLDPVEQMQPHLLDAEAGAIIAKNQFGIEDEQVLAAIRNHTLGRPGMDALSCIVFLADSLEPGRGDTAELETLRRLSYVNLSEAVWRTCDYTLQYLLTQTQLIHPRAVLTRNWFLSATKPRSQSL